MKTLGKIGIEVTSPFMIKKKKHKYLSETGSKYQTPHANHKYIPMKTRKKTGDILTRILKVLEEEIRRKMSHPIDRTIKLRQPASVPGVIHEVRELGSTERVK